MGNWTVSDVLNSRMIYGATPEELLKLLEIAKHAASLPLLFIAVQSIQAASSLIPRVKCAKAPL